MAAGIRENVAAERAVNDGTRENSTERWTASCRERQDWRWHRKIR